VGGLKVKSQKSKVKMTEPEFSEEMLQEPSGKVYNYRHRAYFLGSEILKFADDENFKPVFINVYRQLVDCGTSIGANLVEGKAGVSAKDYLNFLGVALKSANETKYWLCQLRDTVGKDKPRIKAMLQEATELSKIVAQIIINTKGNKQA
jgi:four helix bundle protein